MGATRKSTPERLDKMIQFIWDYKRQHNGETPSQMLIGKQIAVDPTGVGYWVSLLVAEGRLHKISPRPFRCMIIDSHPKNKDAIRRFERILARVESEHAAERDGIRAEQARNGATEQAESDTNAALEMVDAAKADVVPAPTVPVVTLPTRNFDPEPYRAARAVLVDRQKEIKSMLPVWVKLAETRDLLCELVERGYAVSRK